jgi:hypothetical protein
MASSKFTLTKESLLISISWEGVTVFWDHKGVILEHYVEQRETMDSERYSDKLQDQLKPAFQTNAVVCCLLACVYSMTTPDLIQLIVP